MVLSLFFSTFACRKQITMRQLLIILSLFCVFVGKAQDVSVTSFSLDEFDLTANVQGTAVSDQNGEKCALIKIFTTATGFTYEVGILGIVKTEQHTGEIWVYVPHGVKRIKMNHQQYGMVEYFFPMPLESARTYRMVLKTPKPVIKDSVVIRYQDAEVESATTLTVKVGKVSFDMIKVEGGTFTMGATPEQKGEARKDEKPAHQVKLSNFLIGETEVTQTLWREVMGSNPSGYKGSDLPVTNITWDDCHEFIKKLNERTGKTFRLPTEAEWEYAARGGKGSQGYIFSGSNAVLDVAWHNKDSNRDKHNGPYAIKSKDPNELGIYDMSGNVNEWCSDWFGDYTKEAQTNPQGPASGQERVYRGGSWWYYGKSCRVSRRNSGKPDTKSAMVGLRLAMSANQ